MARKHNKIKQEDGNNTFDMTVRKMMLIRNAQERIIIGRLEGLGTVFQSFLDANDIDIIEKINLETETKIFEARKLCLRKRHQKLSTLELDD